MLLKLISKAFIQVKALFSSTTMESANKPRTKRKYVTKDKRQYPYQGQQLTLAKISKLAGLPESLLYSRLANGWTVERATTQAKGAQKAHSRKSRLKYEYQGKMLSVTELSEYSIVDKNLLKNRLRQGWDVQRALDTEVDAPSLVSTYTYDGVEYNIKQLAELSGMHPSSIRKRFKKGWSVSRVLKTPRSKSGHSSKPTPDLKPCVVSKPSRFGVKSKLYIHKGQKYSAKQLSEMCGIQESTLRHRLSRGWTTTMAMKTPVGKAGAKLGSKHKTKQGPKNLDLQFVEKQTEDGVGGKQIKKYLYGIKQMTMQEISNIVGLPESLIKQRVANGWSMLRATTEPSKHTTPVKKYDYRGTHLTIRELAGVSEHTEEIIRARLSRGWSVASVVESPYRGTSFQTSGLSLDTIRHTYGGQLFSINQLVDYVVDYKVKSSTIKSRLENGWSVASAVETPFRTTSGDRVPSAATAGKLGGQVTAYNPHSCGKESKAVGGTLGVLSSDQTMVTGVK